ncbi:hypothetical protein [Chitinophaga caseinilytica]|uniref:hypothetical protein n=1 Tax=Chitinophaga caseinilytica TaxID=2267521 RepID=UPI003C2C2859
MTKDILLNDLLINGLSRLGINVGMRKAEMETALGAALGKSYIETPDVVCYLVELKDGITWTINFDNQDNCYEIKIDENRPINFLVSLGEERVKIDNTTTFDKLVEILHSLNIDWEFDEKRMYLQTACMRLDNGIRLFYAFGEKGDGDYGLFSLHFLLETHNYNVRD